MTDLRLRYQTVEFGDIDVHLCTLRNNQEFHDPDGVAEKLGISSATWPLFGIVWPSGFVLAHHVLGMQTESKRILEVGCGVGLSSLLLNKQSADITATDYHPEVDTFLQRNASLNGDKPIAFERVDWAESDSDLGKFDLIIGSDLLYEDEHAPILAEFIEAHAKPECEVVVVDPGRGRKNKLRGQLEQRGFTFSEEKPVDTTYLEKEFKGYVLSFKRVAE
jgi:predicted nicotinamide N-methyase